MTIHSELINLPTNEMPTALKDIVVEKLTGLFNKTCRVKRNDLDFEYIPKDTKKAKFQLLFQFKYGHVVITMDDSKTYIYFACDQTPTDFDIPFGAKFFFVYVDFDFNFTKATFTLRFNYRPRERHPHNHNASLYLNYNIDAKNKIVTHISYSIMGQYGGDLDLKAAKLHRDFFRGSYKFNHLLLMFLSAHSNNREAFGEMFDTCPTHYDMINDVDSSKLLLDIYHETYKRDAALLKSQLLLLEMQAI